MRDFKQKKKSDRFKNRKRKQFWKTRQIAYSFGLHVDGEKKLATENSSPKKASLQRKTIT